MAANGGQFTCRTCSRAIGINIESCFAFGELFHTDCFRCSTCKILLSIDSFKKDGCLYCREHYLAQYGKVCFGCNSTTTGPVMMAGDVSFHPECFACMVCHRHIGEGDEFIFEGGTKLFCGCCYKLSCEDRERRRIYLTQSNHTIHQLRIRSSDCDGGGIAVELRKPSAERKLSDDVVQTGLHGRRQVQRKRSTLSIQRTPSTKATSLRVGDRVLEVNGVPVTDKNVVEMSELLQKKCVAEICLTLERNSAPKTIFQRSRSTETLKKTENKVTEPISQKSRDEEEEKKREGALSFFNFSIFKRTRSEASVLKSKAQRARQQHRSPLEDRKARCQNGNTNRVNSPAREIKRSSSFSDVGSEQEKKAQSQKSISNLHRTQSFKLDDQSCNQVFRPSELEVGDPIGEGFFGKVVKVTHSSTGDEMVMKQLKNISKASQESFLKEVHVLKGLDHPNVLRFIGVMYRNKALHIITEYVAGGHLRKLLKNKYIEISWQQKVEMAKDIASGMSYLHSMSVIHRDLKSNNCLVRSDVYGRQVVVADFGLACVLDMEDWVTESQREIVKNNNISSPRSPRSPRSPKKRLSAVGSPYWMAPEMFSGKPYDGQADVFSYGIVLCEIIGRVKSDPDYLPRNPRNFGLDEKVFREKFCTDCPEPFADLAIACCKHDPDDRPTFATIEKWLEAIIARLEFNVTLPDQIDFRSMPKPLLYKIEESAR